MGHILAGGIVSMRKADELVEEVGDLRDCKIPREMAAVLFSGLRR